MPTEQWLQVEVDNEVVMHLLFSFISNLDLKPLSVPIEANSGSVSTILNFFHAYLVPGKLANPGYATALLVLKWSTFWGKPFVIIYSYRERKREPDWD